MKNRRGSKGLSVYSNLSTRRKSNKDYQARRKAEYLASLPKHPVKRFLYRLHPKRFWGYWFSREGGIMALKVAGVGVLLLAVLFGALFAYYRRELDAIQPGELAKRVQTTVTRYYDRNGVLLWEDNGTGDYKLVVNSSDISKYMKEATVAIEDKDFYKHGGFSATGILRAAVSNLHGGSTQGGSTLTQQLVKQVFFSDESQNRGLTGVPRKIKEVILAIEVERMYNKDQILTLYLNESPYGGRRNGVESAAQTYFGKSAKDLDLAESALLASIPQLPGLYDPYNIEGHPSLLARQHTTLDYMAQQGYITKAEAETAKKETVLDTIKPESDQLAGSKATHFVQMVKSELEAKLGKQVVGAGGLTIKTTLDYRAQTIVEDAFKTLFASSLPRTANFDNGAGTVIDVPTGQILAMQGSRDYSYPGYGNVNEATAFIQPGSSIKPFVYANLFKGNYGAGSILPDSPLSQSIYKTDDGTSVMDFDNKFRGNIPIRSSLAESRNIPAIEAMYITGRDAALQTIHDMGDMSYCTNGVESSVGLAAAIGGCTLKQIEHANSFATIARMGVYKPVADVLEVKNAQGQIIDQWKDSSKQVVDPQITYILADILSDDRARSPSFGAGASGLNVPGVKTGTKTGTSNGGTKSKDLWMNSFSPRAEFTIWVGNHDTRTMSNALSSIVGPTVSTVMHNLHYNIFQPDGSWKVGAWFTKPAGVQTLTVAGITDLFPSWYNKSSGSTQQITFDKVSKKKATTCTPEAAKVQITVQSFTDPISKKVTYLPIDGYDPTADDDVHKCDDVPPTVTTIGDPVKSGGMYTISFAVTQGTHQLQTVEVKVGGQIVANVTVSGSGTYTTSAFSMPAGTYSVTVTASDNALYSGTFTKNNVSFP